MIHIVESSRYVLLTSYYVVSLHSLKKNHQVIVDLHTIISCNWYTDKFGSTYVRSQISHDRSTPIGHWQDDTHRLKKMKSDHILISNFVWLLLPRVSENDLLLFCSLWSILEYDVSWQSWTESLMVCLCHTWCKILQIIIMICYVVLIVFIELYLKKDCWICWIQSTGI